jgi:hypothetical protein
VKAEVIEEVQAKRDELRSATKAEA